MFSYSRVFLGRVSKCGDGIVQWDEGEECDGITLLSETNFCSAFIYGSTESNEPNKVGNWKDGMILCDGRCKMQA